MIGPIRAGILVGVTRLGPAVWVWVVSLLSALPVAITFGFLVHRHFGASPVGDEVLERLSTELVLELFRGQKGGLEALIPLALGASLFSVGLSAFLDGAVIAAAAAEGPVRTGDFYAGGGRALGRMLRLLIFSLPFVVVLAGGGAFGLYKLVDGITKDWLDEAGVFAVQAGAIVVWLLWLAWIKGASDLMKVEAVAKGENRARWAFLRGFWRAVRHPLRLLLASLPFLGLGVALTLVSATVDLGLVRSADEGIILGLLLQQATAFSRAVLEVSLMGAMVALVRGDRPR